MSPSNPLRPPPPARGRCGFTGASGQCQNPGRWDLNGVLSCTTHKNARNPVPFRQSSAAIEQNQTTSPSAPKATPNRPRPVAEHPVVARDAPLTADAGRFAAILGARIQSPRVVSLPISGGLRRVPVLLRTETAWPREKEIPAWFGTVPNKVPIAFQDDLVYPELILVRLLTAAGWKAAWV